MWEKFERFNKIKIIYYDESKWIVDIITSRFVHNIKTMECEVPSRVISKHLKTNNEIEVNCLILTLVPSLCRDNGR